MRSALVNSTTTDAEIRAVAVLIGGEEIERRSGLLDDLVTIRLHIVAQLGMENKTLIAAAAFCTSAADDFSFFAGLQPSV